MLTQITVYFLGGGLIEFLAGGLNPNSDLYMPLYRSDAEYHALVCQLLPGVLFQPTRDSWIPSRMMHNVLSATFCWTWLLVSTKNVAIKKIWSSRWPAVAKSFLAQQSFGKFQGTFTFLKI